MKKFLLTISIIMNSTFASAEYEKALKDLEVLAKQGDLATQIKLASAYREGLGVPQDYKTAVKWFTLAVEQGNALAQYNLGRLYYLGQGVTENIVYAHMWANQSSSNGVSMGEELTELLTELMSPAEIKEARRLENECVNKNYKGC
jgi:TPR repeat protein